ncbi:MAG: hypothetical protein ACYDIE_13440 [Candidatus Krumholzibacteriia bacterium]
MTLHGSSRVAEAIAAGLFCGILLAGAAGSAQVGSAASGDARIKALLDDAGYKYDLTGDGDFKLVFTTEGERTQIVIINSNTEKYKNFEIREIWSPGYKSTEAIGGDIAVKLLKDNYERKLGAWQIVDAGDQQWAVFAAKVAADLSGQDLTSVINIVISSADELEKELTGRDDF